MKAYPYSITFMHADIHTMHVYTHIECRVGGYIRIHTHNCHIIDSTQSFAVRVSEVKKSDLSSVVLPLPATEFFSVGLSIT